MRNNIWCSDEAEISAVRHRVLTISRCLMPGNKRAERLLNRDSRREVVEAIVYLEKNVHTLGAQERANLEVIIQWARNQVLLTTTRLNEALAVQEDAHM